MVADKILMTIVTGWMTTGWKMAEWKMAGWMMIGWMMIGWMMTEWMTDRNVTLGLFHFIGPANGYTHTLHIHTAIVRLG